MVDIWWSLLGAAIPAVITGQAIRVKRRRAEEQRLKTARGREKSSDDIFVCERVCTSKRMLKKVGAFSKDPTPDTCVTVCGVSELDACTDACGRTVCVIINIKFPIGTTSAFAVARANASSYRHLIPSRDCLLLRRLVG